MDSVGAITLSNVIASGNGTDPIENEFGAYLSNSSITQPTQVPQGITVVKSSFDNNDDYGLVVFSQRKITLTSVNASGNKVMGMQVDNSLSTVSSPVVINGASQVNFNGVNAIDAPGLGVYSLGPLTISGVSASWNFNSGIRVLTIASTGVTITNSQVDNNRSYGIYIGSSTFKAGLVTLSGVRVFANGFEDDAPGVYIISNNKVSFSGGYYMGNAGAGIYLDLYGGAASYSIAPTVVLIGNDARPTYNDADLRVYYYP